MLPVIVLLLSASIVVWTAAFLRSRRSLAVIPWSRRRPVGWSGWEVLGIFFLYVSLGVILQTTLTPWLTGVFTSAAGATVEVEGRTGAPDHQITQLLRSNAGPAIWLLCGFSAVLVAPLLEEFLFRVLLQGWLEKKELSWGAGGRLFLSLPRGAVPVLLSSLPFALLHWRPESRNLQSHELLALLTINTTVNLATLAAAVILLRGLGSANWRDLGLDFRRVGLDLSLGALGVIAILGPAYAIQLGLQVLLPSRIATDPIPLFLLALALGYIYYRTHRLLPIFVLHALFNGFALVSLWMTA